MLRTRKIFLLAVSVYCSVLLQAQERDSVMYAMDSAIDIPTVATTLFFQTGGKAADPSKLLVITPARKTVTLSALLATKQMTYSDHVLADLDSDGKKELLVSNFSGGPQLNQISPFIDEIWFYKNITPNKYQYTGKLIAGTTIVTGGKEFIYNFIGSLGKFFTCDGCVYTDNSDEAPIPMKEVMVKYNKGKLSVVKGDQELRSGINDNLGKLGERATAIGPNGEDDGTRKEIAMNLAVYYYSFGKNLAATKALFTKYYKQADAKKVWATFAKQLQVIGSRLSF